MPEFSDTQIGEAVLDLAVARARDAFGSRLEAAYALGSLAHGGFSSPVSDVDLGLILSDPLTEDDAQRIQDVGAQVRETEASLADRLSVFWGSRQSLMEGGSPGRFPPLDRLDLIRHGRLLHGRDMRDGLPVPTQQDLVIAAARMCLGLVERNNLPELVRDPAGMLAKGPRSYTKTVLFPVRFLYTARTGEIGRNHDAAEHMVEQHPGPAADLAGAALRWRTEPATPDDRQAMAVIQQGLIPLYLSCLEVHAELAGSWGEDVLARDLSAAHDRLKAERTIG
jgi:predicted nucleotidyltransferase